MLINQAPIFSSSTAKVFTINFQKIKNNKANNYAGRFTFLSIYNTPQKTQKGVVIIAQVEITGERFNVSNQMNLNILYSQSRQKMCLLQNNLCTNKLRIGQINCV